MKDHVMTATFPTTGIAALDRFLAQDYLGLRGMSSRFAAGICGHLLKRQSSLGIKGPIVEIGTFEGRFLIAMAMALAPGERALGIDTFDWPDAGVIDRLKANLTQHSVADIIDVWQAKSGDLTTPDMAKRLGGQKARFIHVDGDHSEDALAHDLNLAASLLHAEGLICLDDMLHPAYPFLVATVRDFLRAQPDFRVMLVIDREDIVGAAKFVICRKQAIAHYEHDLMTSFPQYHFVLGGDALGHHCVVLTPSPRLADV
jgi:predicted O-methyltransferase YrrM